VIEHAIIIAKQGKDIAKGSPSISPATSVTSKKADFLPDHEKALIMRTLEETNWNKHQTAKSLRYALTLYRKMKRYGLIRACNRYTNRTKIRHIYNTLNLSIFDSIIDKLRS